MIGKNKNKNKNIPNFDKIDKIQKTIGPDRTAEFLENHHPQTVAVLLYFFNTKYASDVLRHLPDEKRNDLIQRISNMNDINHEVLEIFIKSIWEIFSSLNNDCLVSDLESKEKAEKIKNKLYGGVEKKTMFSNFIGLFKN